MSREVVCCSSPAGERDMHGIGIIIQNDDAYTCSEDDKQWLETLMIEERKCTSKIHKVALLHRKKEADSKWHDPLVVSVGPYHHGKPELKGMEKYKNTMACQYADKNQQKLEQFYAKVTDVANAARDFYIDDDEGTLKKFTDMEFTRIMFVDGCFALQFICCLADNKDLKIRDNIAAFVQRDLYLLENQLPFQFLKKLMDLKFSEEQWQVKFHVFIEKILAPYRKDSQTPTDQLEKFTDDHAHLLAVIRSKLIDPSKPIDTSKPINTSTCRSDQNDDHWSSYRSANELKAAGIYLRPSDSLKFTNVTFKTRILDSLLNLPRIVVDDSTESMLLNMVAYETSLDGPNDLSVSSYICFLDSLIDHAEDVKELRSNGILLNFLGSDQQVADLFNRIADNLVPNQHAYADIKQRIEKHYKNPIKNWWAEFYHTHFTSPWTGIALLAGIIALGLTAALTYKSFVP